jgi:cation:H+ antiporter
VRYVIRHHAERPDNVLNDKTLLQKFYVTGALYFFAFVTEKRRFFCFMMYILLVLGFVLLIKGADFFVEGASSVAKLLKVPSVIIGLTIVALGTSLPELATSCIAAAKGNCDIALGNILGSNIFNVFFILGMSAIVTPLPTYSGLWLDALMVTLGSVLIMIFVYFTKKHEIKRWHGGVFVTLYICYLTYRLLTL